MNSNSEIVALSVEETDCVNGGIWKILVTVGIVAAYDAVTDFGKGLYEGLKSEAP